MNAFHYPSSEMSGGVSSKGFQIILSDGASDLYKLGLPMPDFWAGANTIFQSYEDAKKALIAACAEYKGFMPVLYGEAFPYEGTSFEKILASQSYAIYGWVKVEDEDGDEVLRFGVGLQMVRIV